MIGKALEATVLLILVYLVLSNSLNFSQVVKAISGAYIEAVKTLQGR